MSIQGKLNELNSITFELKTLRSRSSQLRYRKKDLEEEIDDYLESKDQPGLKYKGMAIIREDVTKRKTKKKQEKIDASISVLESHGISDPAEVLEELMEARRGSPVHRKKLKFKKVRQKKN